VGEFVRRGEEGGRGVEIRGEKKARPELTDRASI